MKSLSQIAVGVLTLLATVLFSGVALAADPPRRRSQPRRPERSVLDTVTFMGGTPGATLLMGGLGVVARSAWSSASSSTTQLKNAPVHKSMLEISELIYETCKTYLVTQMKFILILELFIGAVIVVYFGVAQSTSPAGKRRSSSCSSASSASPGQLARSRGSASA